MVQKRSLNPNNYQKVIHSFWYPVVTAAGEAQWLCCEFPISSKENLFAFGTFSLGFMSWSKNLTTLERIFAKCFFRIKLIANIKSFMADVYSSGLKHKYFNLKRNLANSDWNYFHWKFNFANFRSLNFTHDFLLNFSISFLSTWTKNRNSTPQKLKMTL